LSVKSIFKILLGTVVGIVLSMALIEVFNLMITSMQINKLAKTAAYQACAMFTQESFQADGRFKGTVDDIKDAKGAVYCSGNFYRSLGVNSSSTYATVYDKLFRSGSTLNSQFSDFISDTAMKPYISTKLLAWGLENKGALTQDKLGFGATDTAIQRNMDITKANAYYNNRYTPANLGIPYIDKDVCTSMFQWSLTQLLSDCNPDNIWVIGSSVDRNLTDDGNTINVDTNTDGGYGEAVQDNALDNRAVYYRGFACYASDMASPGYTVPSAKITDVTYTTYDLTTAKGRSDFTADTGYIVKKDASKTDGLGPRSSTASLNNNGIAWSSTYRTGSMDNIKANTDDSKIEQTTFKLKSDGGAVTTLDTLDKDNALITVATVSYQVPYQYMGVTPLRTLMSYIWGKEVGGLSDEDPKFNDTKYKSEFDNSQIEDNKSGGDGDWDLAAYYKADELTFVLVN
jgi:hypothetical protein